MNIYDCPNCGQGFQVNQFGIVNCPFCGTSVECLPPQPPPLFTGQRVDSSFVPTAPRPKQRLPHSGLGMASLGLAIISFTFSVIAMAMLIGERSLKITDILGCWTGFGLLVFTVPGFALGVVAYFQKDRDRMLATLGTALNGGLAVVCVVGRLVEKLAGRY